MFKESPFTGACAYATYEVLAMLIGTLLLGVLLGYFIWGWLRRHVVILKKQAEKQKHIADLRQGQIVGLNTRLVTLKTQLERVETKVSLAEFRMRRAQDELESMKEQMALQEKSKTDAVSALSILSPQQDQTEEDTTLRATLTTDEPTLADISYAMETGTMSKQKPESIDANRDDKIHVMPMREISSASLEMARKIFNHDVQPDDLQIIYGIDQKMEDILRRAGILSWLHLAQITLPDLRRIIEDAGPRYRDIDPKTWTIQARMACREEWKKLKVYQEGLSGAK